MIEVAISVAVETFDAAAGVTTHQALLPSGSDLFVTSDGDVFFVSL